MTVNSDTVKQQKKSKRGNVANLKPFQKRDPNTGAIDPRINTKGRPRSFDQLRALAQEIAALEVNAGGQKVSRVTAILMALSSDKKHMREFLEYAFGKVPQAVDVTSGGETFVMHIVRASDTLKKETTAKPELPTPEPTPESNSDANDG